MQWQKWTARFTGPDGSNLCLPPGGSAGVCDSDVEKICNRKDATKKAVWNIGFIGRCLSYQLAQNKPMQPMCRSLVIVAAPQVCLVPSASVLLKGLDSSWVREECVGIRCA